MSTNSGIEWTKATWNPVTGCTRVSPGCDNCYAVDMTHRLGSIASTNAKYGGLTVLNNRGDRHFNGVVRCHEDALSIPLRWKKPRPVFVNSMGDLFHRDVPDTFIDRVFAVMALCPQHTFQILTKRIDRAAEYLNWADVASLGLPRDRIDAIGVQMNAIEGVDRPYRSTTLPLPNVWIGTSCEDQPAANERIPHLLRCPGKLFLSLEPLIGAVDLEAAFRINAGGIVRRTLASVDWVIVGGESGKGARPCDIAWIRSIVAQCRDAGVPCFVKQLGANPFMHQGDPMFKDQDWRHDVVWQFDEQTGAAFIPLGDRKGGEPAEWPEDLRVREMPGVMTRRLEASATRGDRK